MPSAAIYSQLETETLQILLVKERTNLATIATQASTYANSEQPLHQHNQMESILQRIQQITDELTARGVAIPPPHSAPTVSAASASPSPMPTSSKGVQRVTAKNGSTAQHIHQVQTDPTEQIVEAIDQGVIMDVTQQRHT